MRNQFLLLEPLSAWHWVRAAQADGRRDSKRESDQHASWGHVRGRGKQLLPRQANPFLIAIHCVTLFLVSNSSLDSFLLQEKAPSQSRLKIEVPQKPPWPLRGLRPHQQPPFPTPRVSVVTARAPKGASGCVLTGTPGLSTLTIETARSTSSVCVAPEEDEAEMRRNHEKGLLLSHSSPGATRPAKAMQTQGRLGSGVMSLRALFRDTQ